MMRTGDATAPVTKGLVLHWAAAYDVLVWLLTHGRTRAFRTKLVSLARLEPGESVLDVGCGTGSLAIAAKRHVGGEGRVVGIDASPEMIDRAIAKAKRAGTDVSFRNAVAESLPFTDATFDAVLSTLMLHHLPHQVRKAFLSEVRRVLKPEGRILVVDFAKPQDRSDFLAHFHRHGHVDPGAVTSLLDQAGLHVMDDGPVGLSNLRYVLAGATG